MLGVYGWSTLRPEVDTQGHIGGRGTVSFPLLRLVAPAWLSVPDLKTKVAVYSPAALFYTFIGCLKCMEWYSRC